MSHPEGGSWLGNPPPPQGLGKVLGCGSDLTCTFAGRQPCDVRDGCGPWDLDAGCRRHLPSQDHICWCHLPRPPALLCLDAAAASRLMTVLESVSDRRRPRGNPCLWGFTASRFRRSQPSGAPSHGWTRRLWTGCWSVGCGPEPRSWTSGGWQRFCAHRHQPAPTRWLDQLAYALRHHAADRSRSTALLMRDRSNLPRP